VSAAGAQTDRRAEHFVTRPTSDDSMKQRRGRTKVVATPNNGPELKAGIDFAGDVDQFSQVAQRINELTKRQ
jgi:hypothetical protein